MNTRDFIKRNRWLLIVLICVATPIALIAARPRPATHIDSYAACIEAGYPVLQTDPPICRMGSRSFTATAAPQATAAPAVQSVDFEILVDGDTHGQLPTHRQDIIDSPAQWQDYWREVHSSLATLPPIIPVDFSTSTVVGVSLGAQATGGYGLKITGITTAESGTTISLTETTPTITCNVAQGLSNRYLIVRSPKLTQPVNFRIATDRRHC